MGAQAGSFSLCASSANPIVGVCELATAPTILAMERAGATALPRGSRRSLKNSQEGGGAGAKFFVIDVRFLRTLMTRRNESAALARNVTWILLCTAGRIPWRRYEKSFRRCGAG